MTALKCFSKLVKVVRSVFKLVGFKLHALLVQPKHIITDYSRLPLKSYEPLLLLVYILASGGALGFKSQGWLKDFLGLEFLILAFFFFLGGGGSENLASIFLGGLI